MKLAAAAPFLRVLSSAASLQSKLASADPSPSDLERLATSVHAENAIRRQRTYQASATVTLFGMPIVTKAGVGSGWTVIEDAKSAARSATAIRFAAGSWPAAARGLNRVGYIEEIVIEDEAGTPAECAYFGLMTTSKEKNLDEARKNLESSASEADYSVACGAAANGRFASRVMRTNLPSRLEWRNLGEIVQLLRSGAAGEYGGSRSECPLDAPKTFLYAVRKAMASAEEATAQTIVYNGKLYKLETRRVRDAAAAARFAERGVARADRVVRLNATLLELRTGQKSPFTVWFESGEGCAPPLRFEYQARSFLRLAFEVDATAGAPAITSFFKNKQENA